MKAISIGFTGDEARQCEPCEKGFECIIEKKGCYTFNYCAINFGLIRTNRKAVSTQMLYISQIYFELSKRGQSPDIQPSYLNPSYYRPDAESFTSK